MTLYFWLFAYGVLILIAACILWTGVVNNIERKHRLELETKKLDMKAAEQAHKQWMEENGYRTYPEALEIPDEETKKKKGK